MSKETNSRLKNVVSAIDPTRGEKVSLSPDEVRFRSLLIMMEDETISYRNASKIVGGNKRLVNLMTNGVIRAFKPDGGLNRTWRINAADCYRNVKPRLKDVLKNHNASASAV